jgi:hypothetical protein
MHGGATLIDDIEVKVSFHTALLPTPDYFAEAVRMKIIVGIEKEDQITTTNR